MTDLAAIRAELRTLLEKATPGPWHIEDADDGDARIVAETPDPDDRPTIVYLIELADPTNDAALIVALRNHADALLADTPSVEDRERLRALIRAAIKGARGMALDGDNAGLDLELGNALDAFDRLYDAGLRPSVEPAGLDTIKPFLEGWHLTNHNMDAMNAALSRTFPIYSDEEAGTDIEGDAVTMLDTLRENGFFVVAVEGLVRLAALLPTQASDSPEKT